MKIRIASLSACFVLALLTAVWAADVNGKWTAEVPGRQGTQTTTFTFKVEGGKLTGTVSSPQGETAIADGKLEGDNISFNVVREIQGNSIKLVYKGAVAGDEIKFTRAFEGAPGGNARPPVEFTAKRAK